MTTTRQTLKVAFLARINKTECELTPSELAYMIRWVDSEVKRRRALRARPDSELSG
jgi:hypothetical protein